MAHVRTPSGKVVQYNSDDAGWNWRLMQSVTEDGQHPAGAFRLASGKLILTWGNSQLSFGAAAMLSADEGESWDSAHSVSLGWDAPNPNCGYANGAQASDGTIIVLYYVMTNTSGSYRDL